MINEIKVKAKCVQCGKEFESKIIFMFQEYLVECFCSQECCLEFTKKVNQDMSKLEIPKEYTE